MQLDARNGVAIFNAERSREHRAHQEVQVQHLSAYGSLLVTSATAGPRNGYRVTVDDLLGSAVEVAEHSASLRELAQRGDHPTIVLLKRTGSSCRRLGGLWPRAPTRGNDRSTLSEHDVVWALTKLPFGSEWQSEGGSGQPFGSEWQWWAARNRLTGRAGTAPPPRIRRQGHRVRLGQRRHCCDAVRPGRAGAHVPSGRQPAQPLAQGGV